MGLLDKLKNLFTDEEEIIEEEDKEYLKEDYIVAVSRLVES